MLQSAQQGCKASLPLPPRAQQRAGRGISLLVPDNLLVLPRVRHEADQKQACHQRQHRRDRRRHPQVLKLLALAHLSAWPAAEVVQHHGPAVGGHGVAEVGAARQERVHGGLHALGAEVGEDHHLRHPAPLEDDSLQRRQAKDKHMVGNPNVLVEAGKHDDVQARQKRGNNVGEDDQIPVLPGAHVPLVEVDADEGADGPEGAHDGVVEELREVGALRVHLLSVRVEVEGGATYTQAQGTLYEGEGVELCDHRGEDQRECAHDHDGHHDGHDAVREGVARGHAADGQGDPAAKHQEAERAGLALLVVALPDLPRLLRAALLLLHEAQGHWDHHRHGGERRHEVRDLRPRGVDHGPRAQGGGQPTHLHAEPHKGQ
mmetsp:Transcript_108908/g.318712  ORF Transcript_108908/g.318712 Transcript_108908/m.318712 type:complete len:374 (+) Transcript_108908:85-1206(+)